MDIRLMQYYLAVVREGTISAAAEALHVSQPALSRQMKDLNDVFAKGVINQALSGKITNAVAASRLGISVGTSKS